MRIKKPKNILASSYRANRRGDLAEVQRLAPKVQKLRSSAPRMTTTPSRRPRKPTL